MRHGPRHSSASAPPPRRSGRGAAERLRSGRAGASPHAATPKEAASALAALETLAQAHAQKPGAALRSGAANADSLPLEEEAKASHRARRRARRQRQRQTAEPVPRQERWLNGWLVGLSVLALVSWGLAAYVALGPDSPGTHVPRQVARLSLPAVPSNTEQIRPEQIRPRARQQVTLALPRPRSAPAPAQNRAAVEPSPPSPPSPLLSSTRLTPSSALPDTARIDPPPYLGTVKAALRQAPEPQPSLYFLGEEGTDGGSPRASAAQPPQKPAIAATPPAPQPIAASGQQAPVQQAPVQQAALPAEAARTPPPSASSPPASSPPASSPSASSPPVSSPPVVSRPPAPSPMPVPSPRLQRPTVAPSRPGTEAAVRLVAVGDIMLGAAVNHGHTVPTPKPIDPSVLTRLQAADITLGNLEGVISDRLLVARDCGANCYRFRMRARAADLLAEAGFDLLSIANNHINDFGEEGWAETSRHLDRVGIGFAGVDHDCCRAAWMQVGAVRVAFTAFTAHWGCLDLRKTEQVASHVARLAQEADIVLVAFHGGAEGSGRGRLPKRTEYFLGQNRGDVYTFAHTAIAAGADLVVGSGPHVPRAVEIHHERLIAYSLGNFWTPYNMSLGGTSGLAPILEAALDAEGRLVEYSILSAHQAKGIGPRLDPEHRARQRIETLTGLDFPGKRADLLPYRL